MQEALASFYDMADQLSARVIQWAEDGQELAGPTTVSGGPSNAIARGVEALVKQPLGNTGREKQRWWQPIGGSCGSTFNG